MICWCTAGCYFITFSVLVIYCFFNSMHLIGHCAFIALLLSSVLISLHAGKFFNYYFCFSQKILNQCQTVWTQIRSDIMLDLIWVQTVCKDYQQKTLAIRRVFFVVFFIYINSVKWNLPSSCIIYLIFRTLTKLIL